ncbi:Protein gir2 [Knufia obscura]|uniref:Protein gir2 n=2 Tax=Knufia TaxID=430999 RepID=A0AAN8F880_9EURO|nr:Protein gir2 [Knufia obscura]KAK5958858.1 Protein gir2 [Knufia fluminis]
MGADEQKEEREVLDSIFPDEIQDISDTAYRISIALDLPANAEPLDEPLIILLNVSYPETYPDVAPNLDISSPPGAARHPLLDVAADKAQLLDTLSSTIEDSMGMAMVFTLVTTLKDSAEVLMADRQRQEQEIHEVAAREKEQEENRKFEGEKVTRERFLEWREKFKKDMEEKERLQKEEEEAEMKGKRSVRVEEKKLTGRQLWERGLIGKVDEVDVEADGIVEGTEKLKVET